MTSDQWIAVIQAVGFPIAVATWFMLRLNGSLKALTEALKELTLDVRMHRRDLEAHKEFSKEAVHNILSKLDKR